MQFVSNISQMSALKPEIAFHDNTDGVCCRVNFIVARKNWHTNSLLKKSPDAVFTLAS